MIQNFHNTASLKDPLIIDLVAPLIASEDYIVTYRKGGANIVGVTVSVNEGCVHAMRTIAQWFERFERLGDELLHVRQVSDIARAIEQNKLGVIFHFQNTSALEDGVELVPLYYQLGVRVMQLTYNSQNIFGCGCETEEDTGLTHRGRYLIEIMNKAGMIVDVSHAGYRTAMEAIDTSAHPVILSHSNALALCASGRNVPDTLIQAIAQKKGVIGLNAFSTLVSKSSGQASMDQLLDHVDYIVHLVGVEHVSLGLDYYAGQWPYMSDEAALANYNSLIERGVWNAKNYPKPPHKYTASLETPNKIGNLKPALLKRGYSKENIDKILGKNLLRVFSEVWR